MSDLRIDSSTLPDKCVEDMEVYLRTKEIVAQEVSGGHQATILGLPCRVNCYGARKDSSLVIIAARPVKDSGWNFGKCFPELPGASEEGAPKRQFRMRFLTLTGQSQVFVNRRTPEVPPVGR